MLQPLDSERLDALAREDDVDEGMDFTLHKHMSSVRRLIKEDNNWGLGVEGLMTEGVRTLAYVRRTRPMTFEERKGSDDWFVEFAWFPFRDLSLRPSPSGVVDIYAFGKCLKSFQIMGCRKNWPVLVRWIWEYGNQMDMRKSKQEAAKKASRRQRRRVERPLLTQALRPAKFKAQYERKSAAKDSAAISDIIDVIMNDVEATRPLCDTAPDTANSSGPATRDEQSMPGAAVEDVDISALNVIDQDT